MQKLLNVIESNELNGTIFLEDLMIVLRDECDIEQGIVLNLDHLRLGLKMHIDSESYHVSLDGQEGQPYAVLGKVDPICDVCIFCHAVFTSASRTIHLHKDLIEITNCNKSVVPKW